MKYNTKPLFSGSLNCREISGTKFMIGYHSCVINLVHCLSKSIDYVILTISVGRGHKGGGVIMGCQPSSCFEKKG